MNIYDFKYVFHVKKNRMAVRLALPCLLVLLLFLSSCARYYMPPPQNLPLMDKQGEIQVNPGLTMCGPSVSASFSPLPHMAMAANGLRTWTKNGKLNYTEGALGYYSGYRPCFGKTQSFNTEIYAGYGYGNSWMHDTISSFMFVRNHVYEGTGDFHTYFVQGNLGIRLDSILILAGAIRYIHMDYRASHIRIDDDWFYGRTFRGDGLDITAQAKLGYHHVFATIGGTLSLMFVDNNENPRIFRYNVLQLQAGLLFVF